MALKKLANFLGFPVGSPVTGNPELFNAADFDLPSRGPLLPDNPEDGAAHYLTTDKILYRWDSARSKWLSDLLLDWAFNDAGADLAGAQPIQVIGGTGIKAYPTLSKVCITGVTVDTPDATHGGFSVNVGTLATATGLTNNFVAVAVGAGLQFVVVDNLNLDLVKTNIGDAPNTDAVSAQLASIVGPNPDDVKVIIYGRPTPVLP